MSATNEDLDDVLQGVRSQADRERFAEVLRLARQMEDAKAAFKAQQAADRERLRALAARCLQAVDRGSDRAFIVNHLYWHVGDVSAETMAEALRITTRQLGALTKPIEREVLCIGCGAHVRIAEVYTRADLGRRPREWCADCKQRHAEEQRRLNEEDRKYREAEIELCKRVAGKKAELDAEIAKQKQLLGIPDMPGWRAYDMPGWPDDADESPTD